MPVVSNTELCAQKFVKGVAFMFSVLTSIITRKKRAGGIFWRCDGYVYYLDCDDSVTGLVFRQNSSKGTQSFKCVQVFFAYQLHLNKTIKIDLSTEEKKCYI